MAQALGAIPFRLDTISKEKGLGLVDIPFCVPWTFMDIGKLH